MGSIFGSGRSPGGGNGSPRCILAWRIPRTGEPGYSPGVAKTERLNPPTPQPLECSWLEEDCHGPVVRAEGHLQASLGQASTCTASPLCRIGLCPLPIPCSLCSWFPVLLRSSSSCRQGSL